MTSLGPLKGCAGSALSLTACALSHHPALSAGFPASPSGRGFLEAGARADGRCGRARSSDQTDFPERERERESFIGTPRLEYCCGSRAAPRDSASPAVAVSSSQDRVFSRQRLWAHPSALKTLIKCRACRAAHLSRKIRSAQSVKGDQ